MAEDPLNKLVEEITKLLSILEKDQPIPVEEWPEGIEKELQQIQEMSRLLIEPNEKIIREFEKTGGDATKIPEDLPASRQRVLKKMDVIRKEVEVKQEETARELALRKKKEKAVGKEGKESLTRKKKFDRLGRKKNWKPM